MAALPEGVRVVSQRVVDGRLEIVLAVERTVTAGDCQGAPDGASATATEPQA